MKKIAVWGDSISRGVVDEEKGGWVNRLREQIDQLGISTEVYNLGISGEKVKDVLDRFKREFNELNKPDTVIIAIGINDSPHKYHKATEISIFESRYEKLLLDSKKRTKKTILVGITNVLDNHTSGHGYTNTNIKKYNTVIKTLAKKHDIKFVDLEGIVLEKDLRADGLHPGATGHQKIYKKVSEVLGLE